MVEPAIKFDTDAAVDRLVAAGIPREHASAQVRLLANTINDNFATKDDLDRLERRLLTELRTKIGDLRTELRGEMTSLETRLTDKIIANLRWTAGMQVGTILAIIVAIKLL